MHKAIASRSPKQTQNIARELAAQAQPGDVFCLCGQLGAGKTAFSQGFAQGLGITAHVNSPTFALLQTYEEGRLPLYHFDLYRLEENGQISPEALEDIGLPEYLEAGGVTLVEWANLAPKDTFPAAYWVTLERDATQGDAFRKIEVSADKNPLTENHMGA